MWADFYYSLGSCAVSWVMLALVKRLTWDFFAGVCKEQNDKDVLHAKTKKMVESLYRCMFFTVASCWALALTYGEEYMAWPLGGNGDFKKVHDNYP